MKQISFNTQDKITAAVVPQSFDFQYKYGDEEITITVTPAISMQTRKNFCEAIWGAYWGADSNGNYDFRPYTHHFTERLFTLYFYTNIKFDMDKAVERQCNLVMHTDLYECVVDELNRRGFAIDYFNLLNESRRYVELKCKEVESIRAMAIKNQVDTLVEEVLRKASNWLDSNTDVDIKSLLTAVGQIQNVADEGKLVSSILDYHTSRENDGDNNVYTTK